MKVWITLLIIYTGFFLWYTDIGGELDSEEISFFLEKVKENNPELKTEMYESMKNFMEEDNDFSNYFENRHEHIIYGITRDEINQLEKVDIQEGWSVEDAVNGVGENFHPKISSESSFNIDLPRDSSQQIKHRDLIEINYSELEVGDLLFFADSKIVNHVAICIGNEEIIHSSGCVKIEKLKENRELYKKLYKIISIQNIINE